MSAIPLTSSLPLADTFQAEYLVYNKIFPVEQSDGRLHVAIAGEPSVEVLEDLEQTYDASLELVEVDEEELTEAVRRTYSAAESVVALVRELDAVGATDEDTTDRVEADARDLPEGWPTVRLLSFSLSIKRRRRGIKDQTRAGLGPWWHRARSGPTF